MFPMLLLLVVSVVVQAAEYGHAQCSDYGFYLLEGKFGKESHWLCLKQKDLGFPLTHKAKLLLEPESSEEGELNMVGSLTLSEVVMAYGFPVEDPSSGSAEGYIGYDKNFYGVLYLGNRTLYADPQGLDDPARSYGQLAADHVEAPARTRRDTQEEQVGRTFYKHKNKVRGVATGRICELLLLADKRFFERDANSSLDHAVRRMVHAVAQADLIFRNADFDEDGVPDNIGFSVKYILVLTSNVTNSRLFGDLLNDADIDGRSYLMKFARLRRLSEVCLGVAFSGHSFHNRTLGLSFTSLGGGRGGAAGGVCDRRSAGRSFNTLALAHAAAGDVDRVPERVAAMTLTHEIGHSFGAHHDDNFPNPECRGYLMGAQSSTTDNVRMEFSVCSKRLIAATLSSMGYCLLQNLKPYCGNSIVEDGEDCDCGVPSRCHHRDPCCTPRAGGSQAYDHGALHKEGCTVAPTAACHPSQGPCCSHDCQFADLSRFGIECNDIDRECTCALMSAACRCGLGGGCLPDASCHARECALLGLRECQCRSKTLGTLASQNKCGACCLVARRERSPLCVGAEVAADLVLTNVSCLGPAETVYPGPTMRVDICKADGCRATALRAWEAGAACVTNNAVGACSARGVCRPVLRTPRANLYPDLLNLNLMSARRSSSQYTKACLSNFFVIMFLFIT